MKAIKPIKRGEEIFNDYGPLPRSDLLRRYGYVSSRYAQYDVVEFSLKSICDSVGDSNSTSKLQYLDDLDLLEDGYAVAYPPFNAKLTDVLPNDMKILISTLLSADDLTGNRKPPKPRFGTQHVKIVQKLILGRQCEFETTGT